MQEQGVRQDDPEYIKAHNLLAAVQRQQTFQKQRQMQARQLQQQTQQQQQPQQLQSLQQINGSGTDSNVNVPNGVNGMDTS